MRSVQGARRSVRWQARRIDGLSRDELVELGNDEIAELREFAASHWTSARVWAVRGIIAGLVLLAICLVCAAEPDASPLRAESTLDGWLRAWGFLVFGLPIGMVLTWAVLGVGGSGDRNYLQRMLTPLHQCPEWEAQVRRCLEVPACRSYRDRVVARGRALIVRDMHELGLIAEEAKEQQYKMLLEGV